MQSIIIDEDKSCDEYFKVWADKLLRLEDKCDDLIAEKIDPTKLDVRISKGFGKYAKQTNNLRTEIILFKKFLIICMIK